MGELENGGDSSRNFIRFSIAAKKESHSPPSLFWTYTDVTWRGKISQTAKMRGSKTAEEGQ